MYPMTTGMQRKGQPASLTAGCSLLERWDARDDRMARRHADLSFAAISAVRQYRICEAGDDAVAQHIAARWVPPQVVNGR